MKQIISLKTDRFITSFLKTEWLPGYVRHMSYQKIRMYRYGWWKGSYDRFGYKIGLELGRVKNGNFYGYLAKAEKEGLKKYLDWKFCDSEYVGRVVKDLEKIIESDFKNYIRFARSLPKDLSLYSNKQLVELLDACYKADEPVSTDSWTLFDTVEISLISAVENLLVKSGQTGTEVDALLLELSKPSKITPLDREKLSLLELVLLDGEEYRRAFNKHVEEFAFIPMYDMYYEPYDKEYFNKRVEETRRSSSKELIKNEIADIKMRYKKRVEFNKHILKKYDSDKTIKYLLQFFIGYSYLKDLKPYTRDKGSYHYRPIFVEVAKRVNRTLYQTLFMDTEELRSALLGQSTVSAKELDKRSKNSVYFSRDAEIVCSYDPDVLKKVDGFLKPEASIGEIKGTKAFGGFVTGIISLILSTADFGKFKKGSVLVASATRPDFVPIMKNATAIITDEGGILSHAAIVSRELGIPCIVGTKIATKILKDGMMVEVDADRGVVKILKRA